MLGYNLVHLNSNNKKSEDFVRRYWASDDRFLHDVYSRWSYEKARAYEYLKEQMYKYFDVINYKIIGHNTSTFTMAFWVDNHGDDNKPFLVVFTKDTEYCIY